MTNTDPALTLEQRVAELEALLAPLITPRATVPPITVGDLSDVPTVGSAIASQWSQEISHRIVGRYASPAARTTAWQAPNPTPAKGTPSYLGTGDAAEGPEFFNGVSWRKPWSMPWGVVGWARNTTGGGSYGTTMTDIPGMLVTWTAVAQRLYRATVCLQANGVTTGSVIAVLADAANVQYNQCNVSQQPVAAATELTFVTLFSPAAGPLSLKARLGTSAGVTTLQSSATIPALIVVEDAGPGGGPT